MADINVRREQGDTYTVEVREDGGRTIHHVSVPPDALARYGGDGVSAEALLDASFRFLLEREPKEAILRSFEITVIERYFPEYPGTIRGLLAD